MILEVVTNTPFYIWPLLGLLVWGGVKATKTHIVSYRDLCIFPVLMLFWSAYCTFSNCDALKFFLWSISIILGVFLGSLTLRNAKVQFDKVNHRIKISGQIAPLCLSLSIFSFRYFLEVSYAMGATLSTPLFLLENLATLVSGMLIGRLVTFWKMSKQSPHTELTR